LAVVQLVNAGDDRLGLMVRLWTNRLVELDETDAEFLYGDGSC
jgi:hypothetical protein